MVQNSLKIFYEYRHNFQTATFWKVSFEVFTRSPKTVIFLQSLLRKHFSYMSECRGNSLVGESQFCLLLHLNHAIVTE